MAKTACRPQPTLTEDLAPRRRNGPACGQPVWLDYTNHRTLVTLPGCTRSTLAVRRCHNHAWDRHLRP